MRRIAALVLASAVLASAASKTYQVTGPVTKVEGGVVTVQKGKEAWEIEAGAALPAGLKVGDKVTVTYTMAAKSIEVKPGKPAKK